MSFKAINNLVDPNRLVPSLLVFRAYFRINELNLSSVSIFQHIMAMKKAINKVWKFTTFWQVNNTLNTCNESSIAFVYDLLINLPVLVYQEKKASQSREWKRLYNLLSIQSKLVIIKLLHDPAKFKNTLIKPYFINNQDPVPDSPVSI